MKVKYDITLDIKDDTIDLVKLTSELNDYLNREYYIESIIYEGMEENEDAE